MTKSNKVLKALKSIPTYMELEDKAGIPHGIISKAVRGVRPLRSEHIEKLYPVLVELKMIKK